MEEEVFFVVWRGGKKKALTVGGVFFCFKEISVCNKLETSLTAGNSVIMYGLLKEEIPDLEILSLHLSRVSVADIVGFGFFGSIRN